VDISVDEEEARLVMNITKENVSAKILDWLMMGLIAKGQNLYWSALSLRVVLMLKWRVILNGASTPRKR
jgi:hypothetical protein